MNNTNPPEAEIDWHSLSRARGWAMPSPRASAPWTEQEVEDVRAAQQRGESVEEIATAHGRSIGAIESQLNHMAMLAVSPNIKTLHEAGLTISCAQTLELLAQGIDDATVTTQLELRPKSILNFLQSAAKRWGVSGDDMRWEVINKARVLLQLPPLPAPAPEVTKPRLAPAVLEVVELWRPGMRRAPSSRRSPRHRRHRVDGDKDKARQCSAATGAAGRNCGGSCQGPSARRQGCSIRDSPIPTR